MGLGRAQGGQGVGRGGPGPSRRVTCPPKPRPQACGDDADGYRAVEEAMAVIGFSPEEMGSVRRILATILHLVRPPPVWTRPCPVHQYVPRQTSMAPTHQYEPLTPVQSWADQYEYPPPVLRPGHQYRPMQTSMGHLHQYDPRQTSMALDKPVSSPCPLWPLHTSTA